MCSARASLSGVGLLACMMLLDASAHAEPTEPAAGQAAQRFDEGKALLQQKQVDAACEKLEESQNLEPAVGTLGLLAYCRELQGRHVTAWRRYLEAAELAQTSNDPERERVARERAQALEAKLSRVLIVVQAPVEGLVVKLDGTMVPAEQWGKAVPMDRGPIEVQASAPGHRSWNVHLELGGDAATLTIRVPSLELAPSQTKRPLRPEPAPSLVPAVTVGVTGLVLLGVGGYFGLRAISKNDDAKAYCTDNACDPAGGALRDEARSAATISTVSVGLGLIAAGVGGYMLFQHGGQQGPREPAARLRIEPGVGHRYAGVGMRGVF